MPQDITGDEIGPTGLCNHHRYAVRAMAGHGHVNAEATERAAADIERQCCAWRRSRGEQ